MRPEAPSFFGGLIAPGLSLERCNACEKPLLEERADARGRCESCSARDARAVDCGCGFLYAGEACEHEVLAEREAQLQAEALELDEDDIDRGPDPDEFSPRAHGVVDWGGW